MQINFTSTLQDFIAAQRLHCFRKYGHGSGRLSRILYPIMGTLLIGFAFLLYRWGSTGAAALEAFFGLYLVLNGTVIAPYLYRRRFLRTRGNENGVNLNISDESIHVDCPGRSSGTIQWSAFLGVFDGPEVTLLYLSAATFLFVPRRSISDAEHQELLAMCMRHGVPLSFPKVQKKA